MMYEDLEKSRNKSMIFAGVFVLIPMIGVVCCFLTKHLFAVLACCIVLIAGLICGFMFYKKATEEYQKKRKELFAREVLADIFQSPDYRPYNGVSRNLLRCANMIPMGKTFTGSNLISGWRNGLRFEHSDLVVAERDAEVAAPVFSGTWTIVDFNKDFKTALYVVDKNFTSSKYLGTRVLTDNEAFNARFKIYSQSEEKMKEILTPYFMRRIMDITNAEPGQFIFGFVGPIFHIGVNGSESMFGICDKGPFDVEYAKMEILKKAKVITDIVDSIDTDTAFF